MRRQLSRLLKPVGTPTAPPTDGNVYEMRIFRTRAGRTQQLASLLQNELPAELKSRAVACWTGNSGDVNEVIHLSAHPQTATVASVVQRDAWHGLLEAHGEIVEDIESSLMLPVYFSPWS